MTTLEDVVSRLTKPAKDLADWNFPLAEILEKYYGLLTNPEKVNFGEAALVLQNSSNVYMRRIEYLFNDTGHLNQTFIDHQAEEEAKKDSKNEKRSCMKKNVISFNDFEPLDLEKQIGKNINFKNHVKEKPIKLLSQRFTQLESNVSQLHSPIEVLNIHGEIIGKKYDFRCNQQLTMTGMLVDELAPNDFAPSPLREENRDASVSFTNNDIERVGSSARNLDTSIGDCDNRFYENSIGSTNNNSSFITSTSAYNELTENCTSTQPQDSDYYSMTTPSDLSQASPNNFASINEYINSNEPNDFLDPSQSNESMDANTTDEHQRNSLTVTQEKESSWNINESNSLQVSTVQGDPERQNDSSDTSEHIEKDIQGQGSKFTSTDENSCNNTQKKRQRCSMVEQSKLPTELTNDTEQTHLSENDDSNQFVDTMETDAGYTSDNPDESMPELKKRRSKRTKNLISIVNDMDKKMWEPIPFEHGVPDKLPKRRSEFKLPCHISLLKSRSVTRKRKILLEPRKQECLTKFFLNESSHKKMTMYSPTRQLFPPLKKEELEEFQKTFEECFESMRGIDTYHFQAITSITMDLLGFQPNFTKQDPLVDPLAYAIDTPIIEPMSVIASESRISPPPNAFTPPNSPEPSDSGAFTLTQPSSTSSYQELVERRMREILEQSDVQTDLERKVAKWHKTLQPKLDEAERRSAFNIHDYSLHIVESLRTANNQRIYFDDIVRQQPSTEVARYFMASLELANSYNIDINRSEDSRSLELTLLNASNSFEATSNMRHHHWLKTSNSDSMYDKSSRVPLSEMCNSQSNLAEHSPHKKKKKYQ